MRRWLSFLRDYAQLVFAVLAKRSALADRILQKRGLQAVPGVPRRQSTGREGLLDSVGTIKEACELEDGAYRGKVRVRGETWFAQSAVPLAAGTEVRVREIDGLTLRVEPLNSPEAGDSLAG